MSKNRQKMRKICWKRRFHLDILPVYRMNKSKAICMQRLSFQTKSSLARPVNLISQKWMPDGSHMYSDLVRASCFQPALNISKIPEALKHPIVCDSLLPVFLIDGHPLSVLLIPAYGRTYRTFLLLYRSMHDGAITSVQGMRPQLPGNFPMGKIVFTHNQRSCGIPVNPMHNPRPQHSVNPGEMPLTVI